MEYDAVNIEALLAEQDEDNVNARGGAAAAPDALAGPNGLPDGLPPEDLAALPAGRHPPQRRVWPVHKRLQAAWLNEKAAPELLPYESELVADLVSQLQEHVCAMYPCASSIICRQQLNMATCVPPIHGFRCLTEATGGGGSDAHGEPRVHG